MKKILFIIVLIIVINIFINAEIISSFDYRILNTWIINSLAIDTIFDKAYMIGKQELLVYDFSEFPNTKLLNRKQLNMYGKIVDVDEKYLYICYYSGDVEIYFKNYLLIPIYNFNFRDIKYMWGDDPFFTIVGDSTVKVYKRYGNNYKEIYSKEGKFVTDAFFSDSLLVYSVNNYIYIVKFDGSDVMYEDTIYNGKYTGKIAKFGDLLYISAGNDVNIYDINTLEKIYVQEDISLSRIKSITIANNKILISNEEYLIMYRMYSITAWEKIADYMFYTFYDEKFHNIYYNNYYFIFNDYIPRYQVLKENNNDIDWIGSIGTNFMDFVIYNSNFYTVDGRGLYIYKNMSFYDKIFYSFSNREEILSQYANKIDMNNYFLLAYINYCGDKYQVDIYDISSEDTIVFANNLLDDDFESILQKDSILFLSEYKSLNVYNLINPYNPQRISVLYNIMLEKMFLNKYEDYLFGIYKDTLYSINITDLENPNILNKKKILNNSNLVSADSNSNKFLIINEYNKEREVFLYDMIEPDSIVLLRRDTINVYDIQEVKLIDDNIYMLIPYFTDSITLENFSILYKWSYNNNLLSKTDSFIIQNNTIFNFDFYNNDLYINTSAGIIKIDNELNGIEEKHLDEQHIVALQIVKNNLEIKLNQNNINNRLVIDIYDVNGRKIKESKYSSKTIININVKNLKSGLYFLNINIGKEKIIKKFIKL